MPRVIGLRVVLLGLALVAAASGPLWAQKNYGAGVTDIEIKLGQTMPYSGPLSAYGTIGRAEAVYAAMVNDQGGINGRKIKLISLDDSFSPPKTVEQTRKLIEQEAVYAIFGSLGTATNTAIQKYLNAKKVPQLFIASGASKWGNPNEYPWTMGWQPTYAAEARIYARYLLKNNPAARLAVLYQNDDLGKDYLHGLHEGLGERAKNVIAAEVSYEVSDPTVDSQVVTLQASGADALLIVANPKAATQTIRKVAALNWRPQRFLAIIASSIETVLKPAGLDLAKGILSVGYAKDITDPGLSDDAGIQAYRRWMARYYPDGNPNETLNAYGYSVAMTMVHVLRQCGDELTRENLMRQAASLKDLELPLAMPGVRLNTSATDYYPIEQFQMTRFNGERWVKFGDVITSH
jgi:branched-chain amino acid transport system substrate-binding protein